MSEIAEIGHSMEEIFRQIYILTEKMQVKIEAPDTYRIPGWHTGRERPGLERIRMTLSRHRKALL